MGKAGEQLLSTAGSVGGAAVGGMAAQAGGALIDEMFGISDKADKRQLQQQEKLNEQVAEINKKQAKYSQQLQQEMWDYTNYENQVKHMEKAGLNPALLYGMGGGGGSTAGSASAGSISGGQAATAAAAQQAATQQMMLGLQAQKTASEIELNKAAAEEKRAGAGKQGAETETIEAMRNVLVEAEKQKGVQMWLDNIKEQIRLTNDKPTNEVEVYGNKTYQISLGITGESYFSKEVDATINQMVSMADKNASEVLVNNEKAKTIFRELLALELNAQVNKDRLSIEQQNANSKVIEALARKMEVEFNTGETMNWKQWMNIAKDIGSIIGNIGLGAAAGKLIGAGKPATIKGFSR